MSAATIGGGGAARRGPVERLARWWLGQLGAMTPRWMLGRRRPAWVAETAEGVVTVRRAGRRTGAPAARFGVDEPPQASPGRRRAASLRLGPGDAILRTLVLPAAAEPHLAAALRLKAEIETPYRADDVLVGGRVAAREGKSLSVEMAVAPKSRVARLTEALAQRGFAVEAVEAATGKGAIALSAETTTPAARRGRDWASLALAALCLGLAGTALWRPWAALGERAAALEAEIATLAPAAARAEAALAALTDLERREAALAALSGRALAVAGIDRIAEALPDDAWLETLRIEGEAARLVGFARDAAMLPGTLDAAEGLSGVAFRAPVTMAPGGAGERFDIGLTLREASP